MNEEKKEIGGNWKAKVEVKGEKSKGSDGGLSNTGNKEKETNETGCSWDRNGGNLEEKWDETAIDGIQNIERLSDSPDDSRELEEEEEELSCEFPSVIQQSKGDIKEQGIFSLEVAPELLNKFSKAKIDQISLCINQGFFKIHKTPLNPEQNSSFLEKSPKLQIDSFHSPQSDQFLFTCPAGTFKVNEILVPETVIAVPNTNDGVLRVKRHFRIRVPRMFKLDQEQECPIEEENDGGSFPNNEFHIEEERNMKRKNKRERGSSSDFQPDSSESDETFGTKRAQEQRANPKKITKAKTTQGKIQHRKGINHLKKSLETLVQAKEELKSKNAFLRPKHKERNKHKRKSGVQEYHVEQLEKN